MSASPLATKILRFIQFSFSTICIALSGALIQQQTTGGSPTRINYAMYVSAWAIVVQFYLLPASFMASIRNAVAVLTLDALTAVFFLCSGIALAARLEGKNCASKGYIQYNDITNGGGSSHMVQRCREANALTAFMWFSAATFAITALLTIDEMRRNRTILNLHKARSGRVTA